MTLYLVEKDTQVKPLEKALKESNLDKDSIVIPLSGHIFRMLSPSEYKDGIKNWVEAYNQKKLPFVPKKWVYVLNTEDKRFAKRNKLKYNKIKEIVPKITKVVLATDPDPEGASLGYEVLEHFHLVDKIDSMINMSDTTIGALKKELKNPSIKNWKELVNAARGRQKADWILGHNLTVAATVLLGSKVGNQTIRVGPVKSVIMKIVVDRDLQYENFNTIPFWYLTGKGKPKNTNEFNIKFFYKKEDKWEKDFVKEEDAKNIQKQLINTEGTIIKFKKTTKKTKPPKPLTKTALQGLANKMYGFSLKKIQDLMQSLYEGKHQNKNEGFISYPRTDIPYYSIEEYKTFPDIIDSLKNSKNNEIIKYLQNIPKEDGKLIFRKEIYFDPNKNKGDEIPPHFALRPTSRNDLENLSKDELKIYNLIFAYWIYQLYPDYEYENISGEIKTILDNIKATFDSNQTIKKGWKEIQEVFEKKKAEERHTVSTNLKENEIVKFTEVKLNKGETKPKPRFTQATLTSAMENIANLYDDPEIKKQLKKSGIGTPATRDNHVIELINSGFLETEKKGKKEYIKSTQKTREIIKLLPENIVNPIMRAKMEYFINGAKSGKVKEKEIVDFFIEKTKEFIKEIEEIAKKENIIQMGEVKETKLKCPLCGGKILENGRTFKCENFKWNPKTKKVTGCKFSIIKENKFYKLDEEKLEKLLNNKEIEVETGKIILDLENKYFITIDFNKSGNFNSNGNENQKNKLIELNKVYKYNDKFVYKTFMNKKLTKKEAESLLKGKEVVLKNLKNKNGKKFNAKCKLEENGKIKILEFINK